MQEFKTSGGVAIASTDVLGAVYYCAGHRLAVYIAKVAGIVKAEVREACGQCEECYSNGMPHYCESPVHVTAHYYREIADNRRLYPADGGYFVYGE
jgi:hypothetical protein